MLETGGLCSKMMMSHSKITMSHSKMDLSKLRRNLCRLVTVLSSRVQGSPLRITGVEPGIQSSQLLVKVANLVLKAMSSVHMLLGKGGKTTQLQISNKGERARVQNVGSLPMGVRV